MLSVAALFAQGMQTLPNDPAVRVGKLDNGLTYYILHNEIPAQRAEFYLATNVGAIQETPDQDGLAHFLEHMCFNGTKNFPGKGILNYLQSIGASFGGNVNASTGVEQTIYMLNNIPLVNQSVVDSCILIMHDYSHFVNCDPEEIDAERGVIVEERRSRRNAQWRLHERSLPYYYGDSKYATCTLIGSQENLLNFKPESLTNFYHTWYRPDLQAMIVIGDIDVDYTEAKIRETFADIPAAENPKPKDVIRVPDNDEPVIGILTDPETTSTSLEVFWKGEPMPDELNNTVPGQIYSYVKNIIAIVMNERLGDISARSDAPFLNASFMVGSLCNTVEASYGSISASNGASLDALRAFLIEIRKMSRFGFTQDEVSRAKEEIRSIYENAVKNAPSRKNSDFVNLFVNNFFHNEPFMEPEFEYQLIQQIGSMVTENEINQILSQLIPENNLVVVYKAPEKEGLAHPTEDDVRAVIAEVENTEISANDNAEVASSFLDPASLKDGKIKKTASGLYGSTVLTLSNGIKVYLLPTDYDKNSVSFNIFRTGGLSVVADGDLPSMNDDVFGLYLQNTGVAGFSGREVPKMLSGKIVRVNPYFSELYNGVSGSAATGDLETALQLAYLYITNPRFDAEEYAQGINMITSVLPNLVSSPNYKMSKRLQTELYGSSPRHRLIDEEMLGQACLATLEKVYRNAFKDAAGVSMVLVGDFDIETVKPLIAKYVGSLPKGKKAVSWNKRLDMVTGNVAVDFKEDMETPMSTVLYVYHAPVEYNGINNAALEAASYILRMRLTTSLREEEGGTYGAQTAVQLDKSKPSEALFQIVFNAKPEIADRLRELTMRDFTALAEEGPTAEEFDMALKNIRKNIPESRTTNSYWQVNLMTSVLFGIDCDAEDEAAAANLKPEDVQNVLKALIESGNKFDFIMRPGVTKE